MKTNHDELNKRIAALTDEQREMLQHLFLHLISAFEHPELPALFMQVMPSNPDSNIEGVLVHTMNGGIEHAEQMMCNFLAARAAAAGDADQPRH